MISVSTFTHSALLLYKAFGFDGKTGVVVPNRCDNINRYEVCLPCYPYFVWCVAIKWSVVKSWVEMKQTLYDLGMVVPPHLNRFLDQ